MFSIEFSFINGIVFGIEHMSFDNDPEYPQYAIGISLVFIRFLISKHWPEE